MYFSSSCWYLISTSVISSDVAFSSSLPVVGVVLMNQWLWSVPLLGLSSSKCSLSMSNQSASSFEAGSNLCLGKSQSIDRLVSPISFCIFLCAPVQSLSNQSNSWGEGCGMVCLQNEQDSPNLLHTLTKSGTFLFVSIVSKLFIIIPGVLGLFAFIGLYLDLFDHLALICQEPSFLSYFVSWEGRELKCTAIIPWQYSFTSFVILVSWILHLREGKGTTFLLQRVNMVDSAVWSFLWV